MGTIPESGALDGDWNPLRCLGDVEEIERVPIDERMPFSTTYDVIQATAKRLPDRPALTALPLGRPSDADVTMTYGQLFEKITRAANLFRRLGLKPDESVSILLPNIPEFQVALWGAEAAGRGNPINPLLDAKAIGAIIRAAKTRIVITLPPGHPSGLYEKAKAGCPQDVIILSVSNAPLDSELVEFHAELAFCNGDSLDFSPPANGGEIAALYHTGGTTGELKLVTHSHRNQIANAWQSCCGFGYTADDIIFNAAPLFHVTGTILLSLAPFAAGAHVVMGGPDGFRAAATITNFWDIIASYRVSIFCAVPTVYSALLDSPIQQQDISSLRFGICGAAPLPNNIISAFLEKTGASILEGYGMTESCSTSVANPRNGEQRIGAIGIRVPYQDVRIAILDDEGGFVREADAGEPGILLLRGPNVTPGYLPHSANAKAWPLPDWLNTGDTARMDDSGYLFLTGRKKDIIIRGGHNIDPAIVENSLADHPAVAAVAAVGKPDRYAGELPVAYVVRSAAHDVTEAELQAYARERVAERPAAPANIYFVDALPLTAVGKVFKPTLRLDAARRACVDLLTPVLDQAEHEIRVSDDPVHGLVVRVLLGAKPDVAVTESVHSILKDLAIRHEVA